MDTLYEIKNLNIHFQGNQFNIFKKNNVNKAVDNVNLDIYKGETLGLVGESGSGKSTLGKALVKLIKPTNGSILYKGKEITNIEKDNLREIRRNFQIIFQDPYSSLNPRKTVSQIISEPYIIHYKTLYKKEILEKVEHLLNLVGLTSKDMNRYPYQFSGGQRQRIGIARALALEPEFIVCDEPVSALDVSIQAQIINLLIELQEKLKLTYLFISHDLSVVKKVSKRIAVMYLGKIVEISSKNLIYQEAKHPYTRALLSAIPTPNPKIEKKRKKEKIILEGDLPSSFNPPKGCNFSTRCYLKDQVKNRFNINCNLIDIELNRLNKEHKVSCHLYNS
ncbi:MAG: peptide ABC transporter ATP-binding protein [Bacteroidetes bacterium]|jgi:oligopeptide transport system ATP-binding protein|nr:peptide ABC transporter ATP-binding protein [Bacteroidota bacterium]|tara:strand:+ start:91 stop:1095 length:1005 start_codon:yes stop_codon:yes gene_type:complete